MESGLDRLEQQIIARLAFLFHSFFALFLSTLCIDLDFMNILIVRTVDVNISNPGKY